MMAATSVWCPPNRYPDVVSNGRTGSKVPSLAPSSVIVTVILALPAVGSLLLLQAQPSYLEVLVSGSPQLLLQNVGLLLLLPYLVSFFAGVGFAALCLAQHLARKPARGRDFELALLGVALVVPLGFCLGLFGLLNTRLTVPFFIAGLLVYLHSRVTPRLVRWRSQRHTQASPRSGRRASGTIVWGVVAVLIVALTLRHGLVLEANSDVLQLYIPYFDWVATSGSTLLDVTEPRIGSFLTGRGVGPQLLVSTFASGYSIQVLSVSLLIILGLALRGFVLRMLQPIRRVDAQMSALLASAAMSATLSFGLTTEVFGKYHLLTLFLVVALAYFTVGLASESDRRVVHTTGATACAIALPILYLPNLVFVLVALACVVAWAIAAQRTKGLTWQVLPLFGAMCASIISGWVNFKVVGVAGLEAGAREWIDNDLFSSLSSWPLWQYVNDIQGLTGPVGGYFADLPTVPSEYVRRSLSPLVSSSVLLAAVAVFYPARCMGQRQWWRLVTFLGSLCIATLLNVTVIFATSFGLAVLLLEVRPLRVPLQRANSLLLSSRLRFSPQYLLWATFLLSAMLFISPWVAQPSLHRFLEVGQLALFLIPFVLISVGLVWSLRSRPLPGTADSSLESPATRAAGEQRVISLSRGLALLALIWGFSAVFVKLRGGEAGAWLVLLASLPAIVPLIIGPRVGSTSGAAPHPARLQGVQDPSWNGVVVPTVAIVLIQALFGLGVLPSLDNERVSLDRIRTFSATYSDSASVAAGLRGTLSSPLLSPLYTALDAHRCQEIAARSPVSQAVFPINGNLKLSICHGNPEVASRPFVHHYESRLAPYYDMIAVGTPEEVARIFRKLDIDYFVLLDNDCDFWSFGSSKLFSNASLLENFTPYSRGTDFTILTLNPEDSPRPRYDSVTGAGAFDSMPSVVALNGASACDR